MIKDFSEVMSQHTDEELIRITTVRRNDYQPAAIESAEKEIRRRGIELPIIEEVKSSLLSEDNEQRLLNAAKSPLLQRFIHLIIDTLAFWLLTVILLYAVSVFFIPATDLQFDIVTYLILFISFFSYYIFMEHTYQKTLGKFITKTKVLNTDGTRSALDDIAIRTLCRLIPFDAISFLIIDAGFHDRFSNTTVVRDDK